MCACVRASPIAPRTPSSIRIGRPFPLLKALTVEGADTSHQPPRQYSHTRHRERLVIVVRVLVYLTLMNRRQVKTSPACSRNRNRSQMTVPAYGETQPQTTVISGGGDFHHKTI